MFSGLKGSLRYSCQETVEFASSHISSFSIALTKFTIEISFFKTLMAAAAADVAAVVTAAVAVVVAPCAILSTQQHL